MKKVKIVINLLLSAILCLLVGAMLSQTYMFAIAAVLFAGSIVVSYAMPQLDMAFAICGNISKAINPNCNNPLVGGLEVTVYLANKADIASYALNTTNGLILEGITMASQTIITYGSLTGVFAVGEIVRDATLAKSGTVISDDGATTMLVNNGSGTFAGSDVITGVASGATATISAITATTAKFYGYEGIKTSQEAKTSINKGKYVTNFDHQVNLVVFNVDGVTKEQLDKLRNGVLVAIVEYKYKGTAGNAAFEVLGLEQGLEASKLERDSASKDTEGAYQIELKTVAGYSEPHLPRTLFLTDYATSKALIVALT